jgi:hypothetical protein
MKSTLVVGGEASFVNSKLAPALAQHGLRVDANWPWDKEKGAFPDATEVVFVLTDMAGHRLNDAAQTVAQQRSLPIVYGVRKWALNVARLEKMGFPLIQSTDKEPIEMPKTEYDYEPMYYSVGEKRKQDYLKVLTALAALPSASNRTLESFVDIPRGSLSGLAEACRKNLGVENGHNNKYVTLDRAKYEWWCARLHVTPVKGDRLDKVLTDVAPDPVVAPEPVVVAPAPKPVVVPAPAPKPLADEMQDFRDLVNLLRSEMAKRNITRLVVTPENVDVTKTITVNETLGF